MCTTNSDRLGKLRSKKRGLFLDYSMIATLQRVLIWICVLVIASQRVCVNCIGFQLSQGFRSSCVWLCISSTLAAVRLTSVILCNSLLTMPVVYRIYTGLRSASTSRYILPRLCTIFGERAFSLSGPKAWNFASGSISFDWINPFLKKNSSKHFYSISLSSQ